MSLSFLIILLFFFFIRFFLSYYRFILSIQMMMKKKKKVINFKNFPIKNLIKIFIIYLNSLNSIIMNE